MNRLFIDYKSATGTLPVGLYKVFISSPPSLHPSRQGGACPSPPLGGGGGGL